MKRFWYTLLIMLMVLVSCVSEPEESHYMLSENNGNIVYIAFNLITPSVSTRAEEELWDYEDGSVNENFIGQIRFFFLSNEGQAVIVSKDESNPSLGYSYKDYYPSTGDKDEIEKKIYTFPLNLEGRVPSQVIAIINPTIKIKNLGNASLNDLKAIEEDYGGNLSQGDFVMSNSVYLSLEDKNKKIIYGTPITSENLCATEESSISNPVTIYVERTIARLDLSLDITSGALEEKEIEGLDNVFSTGKKYGDSNNNETEINVHLLGWALTSDPSLTQLLKEIDSEWDPDKFFDVNKSWNNASNHRSNWAKNPQDPHYRYLTFNEIIGQETPKKGYAFLENNSIYINENANPYEKTDFSNPVYPTKVICVGQLIDNEGNFIPLAEYNAKYYTLEDLKIFIANELDLYTFKDNGTSDLRKIESTDLTLETSMQHNHYEEPDATETYLAYFKLTDEAKEFDWYHHFDITKNNTPEKIENPNEYISKKVNPAKVWYKGYTYYFFEIPHYGKNPDNPGYYGVVRNHFYNATIVKLISLGTPVYNPDEIIYPEKPPYDDLGLEVIIKVSQWRKANQNFQLSW